MLNLVELYINLRSWTRPSGFSWSDSRGQNHRHWCVLSVMWITRLVTKPTQNFFKISAIWLPQQALYRTMLFSQFCKLKSSQCDSLLPLPVMNISDCGKHFISKKKLKYNSKFLVLTQCCAHFESVWTQRILLGRARKDSCFILLILLSFVVWVSKSWMISDSSLLQGGGVKNPVTMCNVKGGTW